MFVGTFEAVVCFHLSQSMVRNHLASVIALFHGMWRRQHGLDAIAGSNSAAGRIGWYRLFRFRLVIGIILGRFVERVEPEFAGSSSSTCAFGTSRSPRGSNDHVGSADSS